jgi:hypothetical protein
MSLVPLGFDSALCLAHARTRLVVARRRTLRWLVCSDSLSLIADRNNHSMVVRRVGLRAVLHRCANDGPRSNEWRRLGSLRPPPPPSTNWLGADRPPTQLFPRPRRERSECRRISVSAVRYQRSPNGLASLVRILISTGCSSRGSSPAFRSSAILLMGASAIPGLAHPRCDAPPRNVGRMLPGLLSAVARGRNSAGRAVATPRTLVRYFAADQSRRLRRLGRPPRRRSTASSSSVF